MEVFPPEALEKIKQVGGLGDFLKLSLKFAVIDDVISLMSDAKNAREIALNRRHDHQTSSVEPPVHNAWKTVGKIVNNVDSLSESVTMTTSEAFPTVTISSTISVSSCSNFSTVSNIVTCSVTSVTTSCPTLSDSLRNISSYYSTTQKKPTLHWSEGVSAYNAGTSIKPSEKMTLNTLDSIDDYPFEEIPNKSRKSVLDDIDDFDRISDSGSEVRENSEYSGYSKTSSRFNQKIGIDSGTRDSSSRSSTKSDISDLSCKNDLSDIMPKPLKPLSSISGGNGGLFGHVGARKSSPRWDKLENDFESSWNQVSKEEYQGDVNHSVESVTKEVQRVGEEFVRKSDETFVSELAESVVAKLYEGKSVTADERQATLKKVSADIWKDFEKSAQSGKKGTSLWADTPAGSEYSSNMGQFATDFMKKHYKKVEQTNVSPSFSGTDILPQKPLVDSNSFSSFSNNSGFNPNPSPWRNEKTDTNHHAPGQSTNSSSFGYSLFSGPSLGFDSFNSNSTFSSQPVRFQSQNSMTAPFVRPPSSVSSYYQSAPSMQVPFKPAVHPRLPIQPVGMPFPPQTVHVEKCDSECQTHVLSCNTGTMTDLYEPYKQEYLQLKENHDKAVRIIADTKSLREKWMRDISTKDQEIMVGCYS